VSLLINSSHTTHYYRNSYLPISSRPLVLPGSDAMWSCRNLPMLVLNYTASHNTVCCENVCFGASNSVQYVHVYAYSQICARSKPRLALQWQSEWYRMHYLTLQ